MHLADDESALRGWQHHELRSGGRHSRWARFPRGQRRAKCADEHLLQRFRAASRPRMEPELEGWFPRQALWWAREKQRQHGLWHFLQSDRTARVGAVQRGTTLWRQQFHFKPPASDSLCQPGRHHIPESVQWHFESTARSGGRLVAVPSDDVLRRISAESADAVFRPIQPDDQAPVAWRDSFPDRLRRFARTSLTC